MSRWKKYEDPSDMMFEALSSKNFWLFWWRLPRLILFVLFAPAHTLVESLLYTGRGAKYQAWWEYALVSVPLLTAALLIETLAGDMLFLLWVIFTAKWIAEWVWIARRVRRYGGTYGHYHGVGLLEPLGIRSFAMPYVAMLPLSMVLMILHPAFVLVGLAGVLGAIGGLMDESRGAALRARHAADRFDSQVSAHRAAAGPIPDADPPQEFQDVRIG